MPNIQHTPLRILHSRTLHRLHANLHPDHTLELPALKKINPINDRPRSLATNHNILHDYGSVLADILVFVSARCREF